jgi:MoaA/NifB/PqqE/SkfB family radical SAM enzyme
MIEMNKIKKMNIVKKLHQDFVIDKIKETNWQEGTNGPLIVELDTTEACDMACPGCVSEELMEAGRKFTSERLMEIGEEFRVLGVKGVVLIGGGEPLAHPKIGDFMNYLGKNDISIGITTNGSFIDKYIDTIAKYSSWTRVSMDAASNEMFEKLRPSKGGGSKFHLIVESMRKLAKVKQGKLGFSFLIRTEVEGDNVTCNINEIYDAALLAKDIGCDYFEIKPSYSYKNNTVHSLVKHEKSKMEQARREIRRLEELVSDNFSIIKAITLEASLDGADYDQPKDYKMCPATELRTLVTPSGVYVCPYWRGKDQFNIGNAVTTSMVAIWRGEQRKRVQNWLDASKHCSFHCLRHDTNMEVYKMIDDISKDELIESFEEFDRFI